MERVLQTYTNAYECSYPASYNTAFASILIAGSSYAERSLQRNAVLERAHVLADQAAKKVLKRGALNIDTTEE